MNCAMYLRKSRADEQSDTIEETLQRHKSTLSTFAKNNKLNITETYEEVVSGESLYARPQMLRLLQDIENEKYDAVLCMDIDRLGRGGMKDQGIILDAFKYSNTKIITPEKTYDLNDDSDEELTEFKTFISRRELKIINKRLRRGLNQTINSGAYVANPPYGYRKITVDRKPTLEIVEEEAKFVRMVFDLYVNQGMGCKVIGDTITSLGAKPRRGDVFSRNSVRKILRNNVYIGKIVWNQKSIVKKGSLDNQKTITIYNPRDKWTIVDGIHKPIIDIDLYNKAQEIMAKRSHPPSNDGTVTNPLAGLIYCKNCGRKMQRAYANTNAPYLMCLQKGCCAGAKFEYVEIAVLNILEEKLQEIKISLKNEDHTYTEMVRRAIETKNREIEELKKQKNVLYDLLEKGVYDIPIFMERSQIIEKRIKDATRSKEENEKLLYSHSRENKERLLGKIENALDAYYKTDAQTKNKLLKEIIERIDYSKLKKTAQDDFSLVVKLKDF